MADIVAEGLNHGEGATGLQALSYTAAVMGIAVALHEADSELLSLLFKATGIEVPDLSGTLRALRGMLLEAEAPAIEVVQ